MIVSTRRGMHRFAWDLHFDPVSAGDTVPNSDEEANGAVPHRTYTTVNAPWAPPGNYTVRLTVNGQSMTQPLVLRLDPRVRTPAAGLAQLARLSRALYDEAVATHVAYSQARSLAVSTAEGTPLRARLDSLAPAPVPGGGRRGGFGRRGGAGGATPTLNGASDALLAAAMAMQSADVTPTTSEVAAAERAQTQAKEVMARWNALKNAKSGH
jgi:hypothetical protein